jgi:hypothetical protein
MLELVMLELIVSPTPLINMDHVTQLSTSAPTVSFKDFVM